MHLKSSFELRKLCKHSNLSTRQPSKISILFLRFYSLWHDSVGVCTHRLRTGSERSITTRPPVSENEVLRGLLIIFTLKKAVAHIKTRQNKQIVFNAVV